MLHQVCSSNCHHRRSGSMTVHAMVFAAIPWGSIQAHSRASSVFVSNMINIKTPDSAQSAPHIPHTVHLINSLATRRRRIVRRFCFVPLNTSIMTSRPNTPHVGSDNVLDLATASTGVRKFESFGTPIYNHPLIIPSFYPNPTPVRVVLHQTDHAGRADSVRR